MAYAGGMNLGDYSPTSIGALCRRSRVSGYFTDGNGYIGIRQHGYIEWYKWQGGSYQITGTTRTPQGAHWNRL